MSSLNRWASSSAFISHSSRAGACLQALPAYAAAVPLYFSALAGFMDDPAGPLRAALPFLRLSEWLLAHPQAVS
jgi:hypothetical protein